MYGGLVVKALNGMKTEIYLVETETRRDPPKNDPDAGSTGRGTGNGGRRDWGSFGQGPGPVK